MSDSIKIRAELKDGVTTVKALISHPMETGTRKDKDTGELVPAHFIQEITASLNGEKILTAYWGTGVSKNPYLSFKINGGAVGDTIKIEWSDNLNESGFGESTIRD